MRRFRRSTSFNQCDTSSSIGDNGRIRIIHGVEKRCNQILKALREEWYEATEMGLQPGIRLSCFDEFLRNIPGSETYTQSDLLYALKKLENMGFVTKWHIDNKAFYALVHPPTLLQVKFKEPKAA